MYIPVSHSSSFFFFMDDIDIIFIKINIYRFIENMNIAKIILILFIRCKYYSYNYLEIWCPSSLLASNRLFWFLIGWFWSSGANWGFSLAAAAATWLGDLRLNLIINSNEIPINRGLYLYRVIWKNVVFDFFDEQ